MSAAAADGPVTDAPSPFGDISPAELRAALTPESAGEFDRQWRAALARATDSLDLTEVVELLTGWRQVAALTTRLGPQGYRDFLTRAQRRVDSTEPRGGTIGAEEANALIQARLDQVR